MQKAFELVELVGHRPDEVFRVLRQLEPGARSKLVEAAPGLVVVAEQSTADEFARVVRAEARRLELTVMGWNGWSVSVERCG